MIKKVASMLFLLDAFVIGLGAFGHGLAARNVHAAIDRFPIDASVHSMIYVVWYFVSGCMLVFGATLVWLWKKLKDGDAGYWFVGAAIGTLYTGIGIFGLIYRHGDPFMGFFVVLGTLLLATGSILVGRKRDPEREPQAAHSI